MSTALSADGAIPAAKQAAVRMGHHHHRTEHGQHSSVPFDASSTRTLSLFRREMCAYYIVYYALLHTEKSCACPCASAIFINRRITHAMLDARTQISSNPHTHTHTNAHLSQLATCVWSTRLAHRRHRAPSTHTHTHTWFSFRARMRVSAINTHTRQPTTTGNTLKSTL